MSRDLHVRQVGFYKVNCYVVADGRDAVVIDPGDDAPAIMEIIQNADLRVRAVLLTHCHWDHVGAVADVADATGAAVWVHPADRPMLEEWSPRPVEPRFLVDGAEVRAGSLLFRALHTPGHTPGGLCYQLDEWLFTGDTLFAGAVGRTDFPGGSAEELARSLARLIRLPDATAVYPGHGPSTTIGRERATNPFLPAAE